MINTKDKIVETAIELFNKKGCLNTSTRHIADELKISVGNLYYHFKNKEEILIEIFHRYMDIVFKEVNSIDNEKDEIFLLKKFLIDNLEADEKHKFLHLELNLLVMTFPKFDEIMRKQLPLEISMIKRLIKHQILHGYIIDLKEDEINFLVSNSWIIAMSNLTYWNLLSKNASSNTKKGSLNMFYFIKPYLTKKSLKVQEIADIIKVLEERTK